jgi:uncharacterized coiled-coil DUF342 family protein
MGEDKLREIEERREIFFDSWPTIGKDIDALLAALRECRAELRQWRDSRDGIMAEVKALTEERDLYRTRCLSTYCGFCGEHFPADEDTQGEKTDAVQAHIRTCPKHPMRAVEEERDRLRARVEYLDRRKENK